MIAKGRGAAFQQHDLDSLLARGGADLFHRLEDHRSHQPHRELGGLNLAAAYGARERLALGGDVGQYRARTAVERGRERRVVEAVDVAATMLLDVCLKNRQDT